MSRKNTIMVLGAVLMSALLVGAGVAAAGLVDGDEAPQQSIDQQTTDGDDRTITVSASGSVEAEPDQAILRLAVEATDDDPAAARTKVAENASSMREALNEIGIDDEQIRTAGFHIYEEQERPRSPEEEPETTYRARHLFEVELDNVSDVGAAIDAAIDGGATNVHGVEFTLSEDSRDQLRQDALEEAMDSARTQAETIAGTEGLTVTDMHSATTGDVGFPVERVEYATADGAAASASTSVEPGDVTVSATVSVQYNASESE